MLKWIKDKYADWRIDRLLASDYEGSIFIDPFSSNVNNITEEQNDTQQKYHQGMALLKKKIREEAEKCGSFEKALLKYRATEDVDDWTKNVLAKDLIGLAKESNVVIDFFKKLYVKKDKDLKTKKDFDKHIQKRIQDYKVLQEHKELRALNKLLRAAKRENNQERIKELQEQVDEKYRRITTRE